MRKKYAYELNKACRYSLQEYHHSATSLQIFLVFWLQIPKFLSIQSPILKFHSAPGPNKEKNGVIKVTWLKDASHPKMNVVATNCLIKYLNI